MGYHGTVQASGKFEVGGVFFMDERIKCIRESEKKSHTAMYANEELYESETWLNKPIKTVQDLLPLFATYQELNVLDLGCGVGRNCIPIARAYKSMDCVIECVDILDIAIEKLYRNARKYGVEAHIRGVVQAIENYEISPNSYDLILAISALEHVDTEESFLHKLMEIRKGVRENGVVCFVMNANVRECDKGTGECIPAQFEINMTVENMQIILKRVFTGWEILKETVREQQYDIPREFGISHLTTSVVTLVARKPLRK